MKYELAIFDMDGTILDTLEDLTDAMNYCLKKYKMPLKSLDQIRSYVGNGIHKLIERAVPKETISTTIEEIYAKNDEYATNVIVVGILENLKCSEYADLIVDYLLPGTRKEFDEIEV